MKFLDSIKTRYEAIRQKIQDRMNRKASNGTSETGPDQEKPAKPKEKGTGNTFLYICQWVFKLRSVFMAIPVVFAAIVLAIRNSTQLPEKISVYFPSTSAEKVVVKLTELDRGTAVTIPLLITAACIALMCCSRRTVYPWIISIFSLALPLFFWFVGMYPV